MGVTTREREASFKRPLGERLANMLTSYRMHRINSALVDLAQQRLPSRCGPLGDNIRQHDTGFTISNVHLDGTTTPGALHGRVDVSSSRIGLSMEIHTFREDGSLVTSYAHPPAEGQPPIDQLSATVLRAARHVVSTALSNHR